MTEDRKPCQRKEHATLLREEALRLLSYDNDTGRLIWKINRLNRLRGREAGFVTHHGYRRIHIFGTKIDAHRIVWLMHKGSLPPFEIDHANGDKLDNRIENLRLADRQQNQQNSCTRKDNRLGVKGVRLRPSGRYQARLNLTDGTRLAKTFDTAEEAVNWLASHRSESHGEFARTPGKTPAQIAADEREAAIEAMIAVCPYPGSRSTAIDCEALYDAGLRFPKGDDK